MTLEVRVATPEDRAALHALRHDVFVVGQGVPAELEVDARDATAVHVVALLDGRLVGTGRLLLDRDGPAVVGRMAVADEVRGQGVGAALLRLLEREAAERGRDAVELHAQVSARGFYDRLGYTAVGDVYVEAGLEHVDMRKPLPRLRQVRDDAGAARTASLDGCWSP